MSEKLMINRDKAQFKYKQLRNITSIGLSIFVADKAIKALKLGPTAGVLVFEVSKLIFFGSYDWWMICNVTGEDYERNKQ